MIACARNLFVSRFLAPFPYCDSRLETAEGRKEEEGEKTESESLNLRFVLNPIALTMLQPPLNEQAEESEEEEEEKAEVSYDYLSPFLPALIGMQQLTREQAFEVGYHYAVSFRGCLICLHLEQQLEK